MAELRIVFAGQRAGVAFQTGMRLQGAAVQSAVRGAAEDAAEEIREKGAADIAGAGRFGSRWTKGLTADVSEGKDGVKIAVAHSEPLFPVFEEGRTIKGAPLLWVPLSFAKDAQGVKARDFPGPLFRVDRPGKSPLLMAPGHPAQAKYFGRSSVTIPKKFHISEVIQSVVRELGDLYRARRAAA